MPGMDGLDTLNHLRERHIRIPTIVITGSDCTASRAACLNAGAIGYLSKPADTSQLIRMIHEVSEASRPGAPVASI
jgi:CheY-like chemotaxis protein